MQKITPFLWFDTQLEEAANLYVSLFENSKIDFMQKMPDGKIMTGSFTLDGQEFQAMNAGPDFKFNPSISFYVSCKDEAESDKLWSKLSEGGEVLMDYKSDYGFAKKFGWLNDKFGVSWQIVLTDTVLPHKITPLLMYVGQQFGKAEEAINLYTKVFDNSSIGLVSRYADGMPDAGKINHAEFKLDGCDFMAMENSGDHKFTFNEAVSLMVSCDGQAEVDKYWNALIADGGEESQCGWLKDKFGVSWQITPKQLMELMGDPNPAKAQATMQCMLTQKKIIIADLQKAHDAA